MSIINAIQIGVVETWSARMKFVRVRRGGQAGIWRAGDTKLTQQNIHEPPVTSEPKISACICAWPRFIRSLT